jgi:hypothetical protein
MIFAARVVRKGMVPYMMMMDLYVVGENREGAPAPCTMNKI